MERQRGGGFDLCEQKEAKTGGAIDFCKGAIDFCEIKTKGGAIDFC